MKGTKVQKHKSVKMAWERGTNDTAVHYRLQSCGVHTVSYLKTEVILKLILWPQHSYLDLKVSGFPFTPMDHHQ